VPTDKQTHTRTNGHTHATKRIISPATRLIISRTTCVDRCLNGGSSSSSSLLDISSAQCHVAKCSPSAPPTSSTANDSSSTARKKRDRFNGMSDEEVLKLTVPDQLCENLDMVIVSNDWHYSVLARVQHDLIPVAASELFLANKPWTNPVTGDWWHGFFQRAMGRHGFFPWPSGSF